MIIVTQFEIGQKVKLKPEHDKENLNIVLTVFYVESYIDVYQKKMSIGVTDDNGRMYEFHDHELTPA